MGLISKAQKKLQNIKLDINELNNDLDKARGIIKFEAKESNEKILALTSELEKREWYIKGLEESRLRLIEQIREERNIYEQELEINLKFISNAKREVGGKKK